MTKADTPLLRDCAALELAGYVRGLIDCGAIPAIHAAEVQQRINEVHRAQGMTQLIRPVPPQVSA